MKQLRNYLLLIFSLGVITIYGQTPELNRQKYENYRTNLKYFRIMGDDRGQGLLGAVRNAFNNSTQSSDLLKSGEGGIMQGWYIGMLATEYARLVQDGASINEKQATIDELYYALSALERLDDVASSRYYFYSLGQPIISNPRTLDGVAVRTDMWNDFKPIYWQQLNESSYPSGNDWADITSFERYFNTYYPNSGYNYSHVFFSQDQLYHVLMGLYLVYHYLPSSNLTITVPSPTGSSINFRDKAANIALTFIDRVINDGYNLQDPAPSNLPNEQGGQAWAFTEPLRKMAVLFGSSNVYNTSSYDYLWEAIYVSFGGSIDNRHMALTMAAISNEIWSSTGNIATTIWNDSYDSNDDVDWRAFYPLLHNNLHGVTPLTPSQWCYIEQELNSAPIANPQYMQQQGEWRTNLRYLKEISTSQNGAIEGIFPGIDYMLLYNLYALRWRPTKVILSDLWGPYSGWDVVAGGPFSPEVQQVASIEAQNSIKLVANFTVNKGDYFHAYINNNICTYSGGGSSWRQVSEEEEIIKEEIVQVVNTSIYPNPNNGKFNIEVENTEEMGIVEVYDIMGKMVHNQIFSTDKLIVNISDKPKGIYIVKVTMGDKVITDKIIYQ